MRPVGRRLGALVAWQLVLAVGTMLASGMDEARAQLSEVQQQCFLGNAKACLTFVTGRLKAFQKCTDARLKDGSCAAPDPAALEKLAEKLNAGIEAKCAISAANFANMGFPAQCEDTNPADGFTTADLQNCMEASQAAGVDAMLPLAYDPALTGPVGDDLKCQREFAKNGFKFAEALLKSVQKCRNGILTGKLAGVSPASCATDDPKTAEAIAKARATAQDKIVGKCTDLQAATLELGEPDQANAAAAADCLLDAISALVDNPDKTAGPDLVDYAYAVAGTCGDNRVNSLDEECDGTDAAACPGQCGTAEVPDGYFACLCKTKPRLRVIEHVGTDYDNGWTGVSHDQDTIEGGGYVVDLYDCDGSGRCIVGPSCSLPPHAPCAVPEEAASGTTGDSLCAALGQGTCRKERTATGPHCYKNIQKKCDPGALVDPACSQPGDFCVKTFHMAPLPISAGGVSVCAVNVFSEDITGTTNEVTGESELHVRQRSISYFNTSAANAPCPVCGGFCAGNRTRCAGDTDCGSSGPCVMAPLCSSGPNEDQPCRVTPPFGSTTALYGTTSIDCPPLPPANISGRGLDVLFDPASTGTTMLAPSYACDAQGFGGNTCIGGGPNEGRPCSVASDCPAGSCSPQCYCPPFGSTPEKPNACDPACVGGANDRLPCLEDSECPDGFCHQADCRVNPADTDSAQEGRCTTGPAEGRCSISSFKSCGLDADCRPPLCAVCQPTETCLVENRQCFVNGGIIRQGSPGVPDRTLSTSYCAQATGQPAVNLVSGLPGPGAITQPTTVIRVP